MSSPYPQVRLAELVATMSLGTDLGLGQPMAHVIRQTLIALLTGEALGEHEAPPEATLQVLSGQVRLTAGEDSWQGRTGDLVIIPDRRHDLLALADSIVLLTTVVDGAQ